MPEEAGIGATPAARASLASEENRVRAGDFADELAGRQRPEAGLGDQLRRDGVDEVGDLCFERVDRVRELAHVTQLVARDPDPRGLLGARQAPADRRLPFL